MYAGGPKHEITSVWTVLYRPSSMTVVEVLDLLEAEGFELSLCLTLTMTRRVNTGELRF